MPSSAKAYSYATTSPTNTLDSLGLEPHPSCAITREQGNYYVTFPTKQLDRTTAYAATTPAALTAQLRAEVEAQLGSPPTEGNVIKSDATRNIVVDIGDDKGASGFGFVATVNAALHKDSSGCCCNFSGTQVRWLVYSVLLKSGHSREIMLGHNQLGDPVLVPDLPTSKHEMGHTSGIEFPPDWVEKIKTLKDPESVKPNIGAERALRMAYMSFRNCLAPHTHKHPPDSLTKEDCEKAASECAKPLLKDTLDLEIRGAMRFHVTVPGLPKLLRYSTK